MVNASNRQRRLDFVLDTSHSETDGTIEYRPKRIELGGVAYPKCLKSSMSFAVDRTPNFTRYLLDVLYKKAEERNEEEEEVVDEVRGGSEQLQGQSVELTTGAEQSAVENGAAGMEVVQTATSEAVTV